MTNLRLFFLLSAFVMLFSTQLFAQMITIEIDKKDFKIDEPFKITYTVRDDIDSVKNEVFKDFIIQNKARPITNTSFIQGSKTLKKVYSYVLKSAKSGNLIIKSPHFYKGAHYYKGEDILVYISKDKISTDDLEFLAFKTKFTKPEGTLRYVLQKEMGYVEIYKNGNWQFERQLSKKELKKIQALK